MFARAADWLGPIFVRELIQLSRRRRYYVLRSACAALLLFSAYRDWNDVARYVERSGTDLRVMSELGERLFWSVVLVQCGITFVLLPIMLCDTVVAERRQGTLDGLLTSPLSDREILLGLMASRIGVAALLLAATFPILAIALLFGGVEWADVLGDFAIQIASMVIVGATTICYSAICKSGYGTLGRTYITLAGFAVLFSIACGLIFLCGLGIASTVYPMSDRVPNLLVWTVVAAYPIATCVVAAALLGNVGAGGLRLAEKQSPVNAQKTSLDRGDTRPSDPYASFVQVASAFVRRPRIRFGDWPTVGPPASVAEIAFVVAFSLVLPTATVVLLSAAVIVVFGSGHGAAALWGLACVIGASVAVNNKIASSRTCWRDGILAAPLDGEELVGGCLRQTEPSIRRIAAAVAFGCLPLALAPVRGMGTIFAALMFVYLVLALGTMLAIMGGRATRLFAWTVAFPLLIFFSTTWLRPFVVGITPVGILGLGLAAYGLGKWQSRFVCTAESVVLVFIGVHLVLVAAIVSLPVWALNGFNTAFATDVINPGYWLVRAHPAGIAFWLYRRLDAPPLVYLTLLLLAYGLNLLWAWRWTIRNFDRLTGRVVQWEGGGRSIGISPG